jgi:ribosome-binding factor A
LRIAECELRSVQSEGESEIRDSVSRCRCTEDKTQNCCFVSAAGSEQEDAKTDFEQEIAEIKKENGSQ